MDIRKDLNDLGMTANGSHTGVHWTDRDGNRYHVWLAVHRPAGTNDSSPNNGYEPLRPFRVVREFQLKTNGYTGPQLLRKNKTRRDPGNFECRKLDAEARANAPVVTEALRRAEEQGLFEAAVAEAAAKEAAEEARRKAKRAADIREKLTTIAENEGPAQADAYRLLDCSDDVLLVLSRAF